nr:PREDICTED: PGC-1 and ERR-induced regulator in muscle protein 1 [Lepisosteus oculatus]
MYDYFFSEFETEGLFLPAVWRSRENVACSRPPDEDLLLPETSDCLFPEDEPRAVGDEESCGPVRVVTRLKDSAAGPLAVSGPDAYEHFFAGSEWERNSPWRNFTSLRRRCFTRGSENARGDSSSSLLPKKYGKVFQREVPRGYTERRSGNSPSVIHFLKDQILRHLEEQRSRSTDPSSAVAVPRNEGFLLSLSQSDMCLVCIAFASWVLKSANPHAADGWKSALLANISAISAIRYLRRSVKEEKPAGLQ